MAPRRNVKSNVYVANNTNYNDLILNDVLCPICRSILIEPVTLPCTHGFCSSCFEGTVANANLVCPLCRIRIGSWLRTSKKCNKVVNSLLWDAIKKKFPNQVKSKLEGQEEYLDDDISVRKIATPGEIRREYELLKAQEQLQLEKERQKQAEASEKLIQELKKQEEREEALRLENIRLNEEAAKKLAQEYEKSSQPSSSITDENAVCNVQSKKQGPLDTLLKNMDKKTYVANKNVTIKSPEIEVQPNKQYTCKILCQGKEATTSNDKAYLHLKLQQKLRKILVEGESSDSNDSIDAECRHFKPIEPYFPVFRTVSVIKVPAKIVNPTTVIIRPPLGESTFNYNIVQSAFAKLKPKVFTTSSNTDTKNSELKRKVSNEGSCENTPTLNDISKMKSDDRKTPLKKRRLLREIVPADTLFEKPETLSSPPFKGFDNKNDDDDSDCSCKKLTKNNGVAYEDESTDDLSGKELVSRQLQEEEDLKLARKLHEELNTSGRHSKRNDYSINTQFKNQKTPSKKPRQTTLTEMLSKSVKK